MKKANSYSYSFSNMFFDFLKDKDVETLFSELDRVNKIVKNFEDTEPFPTIMLRFGENSTILYTIAEIKTDISLPENHPNKKLLLELMQLVTEDINPEKELQVYL